jgi:hypothetical protein
LARSRRDARGRAARARDANDAKGTRKGDGRTRAMD